MLSKSLRFGLLSLVVAVSIAAPCVVPTYAQSSGASDHDPIAAYKAIGINAIQEDKIRTLARAFEEGAKRRYQTMIQLMKGLRDLQFQPDPKANEVLSKQEEINKLQADMAIERMKLMLAIRAVLNPDQKKKLVEAMEKRAEADIKATGAAVAPKRAPNK